MSDDRTTEPTPQRRLREPEELRALAHPLRLRLLEELIALGEATATELGQRVGESPANCSWHLRQLARYGFIEEAGGGTGRQRPWRWIRASLRISAEQDESPETHLARDAAVDVILDREVEAWHAWRAERHAAPPAWREASFDTSTVDWLTAEELAGLKREINELVDRHVAGHLDRADPAARPSGARLVRFVTWGFPAGPVDELPAEDTVSEPDPGGRE